MKRKLDKNKIYAFIGKTVVWTSIHILLGIAMFDVALNCMTVYKQKGVKINERFISNYANI